MDGRLQFRASSVSDEYDVSAWLPFEVLYRVGDVHFLAIDSRFFERLIHDFSGGPNERFARDVFVIARLFANEHDRRALWAFAKDSLRCSFVKMTRRAFARRGEHFY